MAAASDNIADTVNYATVAQLLTDLAAQGRYHLVEAYLAAAVLYLSSPAGAYVTGKVIEVDGGIEQPNLDLGFADL